MRSLPTDFPATLFHKSELTLRLIEVSARKPFTVTLNKIGTSPLGETRVFLTKNRILNITLFIHFLRLKFDCKGVK